MVCMVTVCHSLRLRPRISPPIQATRVVRNVNQPHYWLIALTLFCDSTDSCLVTKTNGFASSEPNESEGISHQSHNLHITEAPLPSALHLGYSEVAFDPPKVPGQATPQEKWLIDWEAWGSLFQETWYLNREKEPSNYSGKSVLTRWLDPYEDEGGAVLWRCHVPMEGERWCHNTTIRLDRGIAHVRNHLNFKPYRCEGQCGDEDWYA